MHKSIFQSKIYCLNPKYTKCMNYMLFAVCMPNISMYKLDDHCARMEGSKGSKCYHATGSEA
uniref:Uncharacterized protein n=1 Tax=Arundo donax TaxID=35708 RepID=A0A0A8XXL6_ARUDO